MRLKISLLLVLLSGASCERGIVWDPDFYVGDYARGGITNERDETTYCYEEKFNHFACLSEDKVKELREILAKARMPKAERQKLDAILKSIKFKGH